QGAGLTSERNNFSQKVRKVSPRMREKPHIFLTRPTPLSTLRNQKCSFHDPLPEARSLREMPEGHQHARSNQRKSREELKTWLLRGSRNKDLPLHMMRQGLWRLCIQRIIQ